MVNCTFKSKWRTTFLIKITADRNGLLTHPLRTNIQQDLENKIDLIKDDYLAKFLKG